MRIAVLLAVVLGLTTGCAAAGAPPPGPAPAIGPVSSGAGTPSGPPVGPGSAFDKVLPASVEQLPLLDDRGHATSLAALHGKTVVLADFLTLCQEVCPMVSANMAAIGAALAKSGLNSTVELVEVTVDPQRDTPARLAAYRRMFPAVADWSLLTGMPRNIAALWSALGVAYARTPEPAGQPAPRDWWTGRTLTYDVAHSDIVFFLDSAGHERYVIDANPDARNASLPAPLRGFLDSTGTQNRSNPAAGSWTPAQAEAIVGWLTGHRVS